MAVFTYLSVPVPRSNANSVFCYILVYYQGFTYPVRCHFLENILETTGYRLTPYNQIDNYGQDKLWKMQKQTHRKRKTQIASAVEVYRLFL